MARQVSALTHARVLELFDYDVATGHLTWRLSTSNRIRVGELAGSVASNGRRYIHVDGEAQMAHRLVWFWHKGEWPLYHLAPADLDHLNTRIGNLIEQTPRETVKKGGLRSTNKTGIKGVHWDELKQEYIVFAYIEGKGVFHSGHKTLEAAAVAAKDAALGIVPTAEERQATHDLRIENKRLWARMIKWCKGLHRWESVEQFLTAVGGAPHEGSRLVPADHRQPLGPENFRWTAIGEDHRSGNAKQQAHEREKNPERYRDGHLRRKFKSSHKRYVEKLLEQKGVCAICSNPETRADKNGRVSEFHFDHNHQTGEWRGLLCFACNTAIGHMREDTERLKSAIRYLNRWNGVEQPDNVVPINATLAFGA